MSATHRSLPLTPEAYLEWEKGQPEKHEYLDGLAYQVYAMVGARDAHVTVAGNVFALLREHLRGGPCRVYISDMKLRVDAADAYFYPDVFVTCDPRDRGEEYVKRYPVLVVEVLSESTAAFDRGRKFAIYRRLESLREYVVIDPALRSVDCFRRDPSGHWVLYAYEGDATLDLDCIGGRLALTALFEDVEPGTGNLAVA
jgi:Uma2 family endonuclease